MIEKLLSRLAAFIGDFLVVHLDILAEFDQLDDGFALFQVVLKFLGSEK